MRPHGGRTEVRRRGRGTLNFAAQYHMARNRKTFLHFLKILSVSEQTLHGQLPPIAPRNLYVGGEMGIDIVCRRV
jgi:hypothetical protein